MNVNKKYYLIIDFISFLAGVSPAVAYKLQIISMHNFIRSLDRNICFSHPSFQLFLIDSFPLEASLKLINNFESMEVFIRIGSPGNVSGFY